MKRVFLLLVTFLVASMMIAQAQENTVLNSYRVIPKPGKDRELKKALTDHAAKYHKGDWKWRVFQILSGPDEGAYQMNEGLTSWTTLEGRKDISDEHTRDYETTVLPLIDKTLPASFSRYEGDLSTSQYAGKFKKVLIRHYYLKPGKMTQFKTTLATWKKVYEKTNKNVTVWSSFFSDQPQITIAFRLAEGWADIDHVPANEFATTYDQLYGAGANTKNMEVVSQCVERILDEMYEFLPEVSSPELSAK
jgi:hypothetical protein